MVLKGYTVHKHRFEREAMVLTLPCSQYHGLLSFYYIPFHISCTGKQIRCGIHPAHVPGVINEDVPEKQTENGYKQLK